MRGLFSSFYGNDQALKKTMFLCVACTLGKEYEKILNLELEFVASFQNKNQR